MLFILLQKANKIGILIAFDSSIQNEQLLRLSMNVTNGVRQGFLLKWMAYSVEGIVLPF